MLKQAHIFIYGDVIGVGFRAWTEIQAKSLKIKGWVRNNYDKNCVEALLQAEQEHIEKLIKKLEQGPPISSVNDIEIIWEDPKGVFGSFEIVKKIT